MLRVHAVLGRFTLSDTNYIVLCRVMLCCLAASRIVRDAWRFAGPTLIVSHTDFQVPPVRGPLITSLYSLS